MKKLPLELMGHDTIKHLTKESHLSLDIDSTVKMKTAQYARQLLIEQKNNPRQSLVLGILPLVLLIIAWWGLFFKLLPLLLENDCPPWLMAVVFVFYLGLVGYSWVIYTLHEGGGHKQIILDTKNNSSRFFKSIRFLLHQLSRLKFADPEFYRKNHETHHRYTGTEKDETLTHFVLPVRLLLSLIPGAGIFWWNEFQVHTGKEFDRSKIISHLVGTPLLLGEIYLSWSYFGVWSIALVSVLAPWIGFIFDRVRECSEHNLIVQEGEWGARDFGLSFYGIIVGGGPWGQCCHLSHHLAPSLQWYNQWRLHFYLKKLLNKKQISHYLPLVEKQSSGLHFFSNLIMKNHLILKELKSNKDQANHVVPVLGEQ